MSWLRELLFSNRSSEDQTSVSEAQLNEDNDVDPFNPFPDPVTIEITDIIDLHTIQPPDVKRVVEEYLREAHTKGFRSVRIIHGKGIGVQRQIVRTVLERTAFVHYWVDAPPGAGGLGATIVHFKSQQHGSAGE